MLISIWNNIKLKICQGLHNWLLENVLHAITCNFTIIWIQGLMDVSALSSLNKIFQITSLQRRKAGIDEWGFWLLTNDAALKWHFSSPWNIITITITVCYCCVTIYSYEPFLVLRSKYSWGTRSIPQPLISWLLEITGNISSVRNDRKLKSIFVFPQNHVAHEDYFFPHWPW